MVYQGGSDGRTLEERAHQADNFNSLAAKIICMIYIARLARIGISENGWQLVVATCVRKFAPTPHQQKQRITRRPLAQRGPGVLCSLYF